MAPACINIEVLDLTVGESLSKAVSPTPSVQGVGIEGRDDRTHTTPTPTSTPPLRIKFRYAHFFL